MFLIKKLKVGLQLNFPMFMANIIRILLSWDEEPLACYLTAFYKISLDENIIEKAVKQHHFEWLKYIWAFE